MFKYLVHIQKMSVYTEKWANEETRHLLTEENAIKEK